jgi:hypothetical protein
MRFLTLEMYHTFVIFNCLSSDPSCKWLLATVPLSCLLASQVPKKVSKKMSAIQFGKILDLQSVRSAQLSEIGWMIRIASQDESTVITPVRPFLALRADLIVGGNEVVRIV